MSWALRRTNGAETDLLDIWDYVAAENAEAADRLIRDIAAHFEKTADFPRWTFSAPGLGRSRMEHIS